MFILEVGDLIVCRLDMNMCILNFLNFQLFFPQVDAVTQELKLTVIRGREQRDKLLLEVDRLKQARFFCEIFAKNFLK
jgi:hypothetical protein